jgi:hypothetical protein
MQTGADALHDRVSNDKTSFRREPTTIASELIWATSFGLRPNICVCLARAYGRVMNLT